MVVVHDWEKREIENILSLTKQFVEKHHLKVIEIAKNVRDGGYVQFATFKSSMIITIYYLPNYDVILEKNPHNLGALIKLLNAIMNNDKYAQEVISLKELLNDGKPIVDLEDFLNTCMQYIETNFKLY